MFKKRFGVFDYYSYICTLKQQKNTTMSRTKNYIEDLIEQGIDVFENSLIDAEYYELIASETPEVNTEHIHILNDGRN